MITKLWSISKFMTSQTGQQIITIHILPNVSRSKGNQEMKLGQIIKYNMRSISLQKTFKNGVGRLVPDLFLFFKNSFIEDTLERLAPKFCYILVDLELDIQ